MYGPLIELVCAGVTLYEYYSTSSSTTTTVLWEITGWWSAGSSISILLWFHQYLLGGPNQGDLIFSHYNFAEVVVYSV